MRKSFLGFVFLLVLLFTGYRSITMSSGPPEAYSNAPGEGNCANPGCHGGTEVTSGPIWDNINLSVSGTTLSNLVADSTYTFTLSFANPTSIKYGFQLCVLPTGASSMTQSLGTLITTSTETQLVSSPDRTYIEHTSSGTSAPINTKSWAFNWQAPTGYAGGAVFYVVVNSTNNDGTNGGDTIYAKTFTASVSLPVSWLSVDVIREHSDIILKWITASEVNADQFIVERSYDGRNWQEIGSVKANGTSTVKHDYYFKDWMMNQKAYYRLKQLDYNGSYAYSEIVSASASGMGTSIQVNYERNELYSTDGKIGRVDLYDHTGALVWSSDGWGSTVLLPILPKGIYFLRSENGVEKVFLK